MTISLIPTQERPREKLLLQGADALSDAELIAILLRTGVRGKSAIELARDLLNHFGSLGKLLHCDVNEFCAVPGLGSTKYTQVQTCLALLQRYLYEQLSYEDLSSCHLVKQFLMSKLRHLPHEVFACLLLNGQNQLLHYTQLAHGTHNETRVYPREVVKTALKYNASAVILAHNHPSGNCQASQADLTLTEVLQEALGLVDIIIHDHIIIAGSQTLSFAERGYL